MKGKIELFYNPTDISARTMNERSNWQIGEICLSDIPEKGQIVYVNRPQNNAYAEECKVEYPTQQKKGKKNADIFFKARAHDNWAHYFTPYDVGNDIFYNYTDAQNALRQTLCTALAISINEDLVKAETK